MSALASDSVAEQLSAIVHRQEHHALWVKAFRAARSEGLELDAAASRADSESASAYNGGASS